MAPASDGHEPVARHSSRHNLERLLDDLIDHPERHADTLHQVDLIFGQDKAVRVLDMSGFSRTTHQHGVVPCIAGARGLMPKAEADNLFARFDTVEEAVQASRAIIPRLNAANTVLPDDRQLYVSVGIGYGHLLNVEDRDVFGGEVNLASRLGEDIAGKAEVLLTANARSQLRDRSVELREESVSVSGLALTYYRLLS